MSFSWVYPRSSFAVVTAVRSGLAFARPATPPARWVRSDQQAQPIIPHSGGFNPWDKDKNYQPGGASRGASVFLSSAFASFLSSGFGFFSFLGFSSPALNLFIAASAPLRTN